MSKTKVFISSTCFDLHQIRRDLEDFVISLGHQPVLSDSRGIFVPAGFGKEEALKYLVKTSDIFVLIIGGRYGTEMTAGKSITNMEYEWAVESDLPIYTFVDKEVWSKRDTYYELKKLVKDGDFKPETIKQSLGKKVEDPRVYDFIEQVDTSKKDNWIYHFTTAQDIIDYLRNQWSGLFRELLRAKRGVADSSLLEKYQPNVGVDWYLKDETVKEIKLSPPPKISKKELNQLVEKFKEEQKMLKNLSSFVKSQKEIIKLILNSVQPSEIGLSRRPFDINSFLDVERYIQALPIWEKMCSDESTISAGIIDAANRTLLQDFAFWNEGTCVAENITVYIHKHKDVAYIKETELYKFGPCLEMPIYISSLLKIKEKFNALIKKLDVEALRKVVNNVRSYKSGLEGLKGLKGLRAIEGVADVDLSGLDSLDNLDVSTVYSNASNVNIVNTVVPRHTKSNDVFLEKDSIRFDISKLKHGFQRIVRNNNIYICLTNNNIKDDVMLEYTCYLENFPKPHKGKLKIVVKP